MKKENTETTHRSGGPRTEEGKARSSKNSRRHGVLSDNVVVLQTESTEAFLALKRNYYDTLEPVGFLECELVDDIVWSKWRQMRAMRVETATIDEQMDLEAAFWQRECPAVDSATRTSHAIRSLVDESNDLQHLSRYETRFHRMYMRSLRQLLELQEKRRLNGADTGPRPSSTLPAAQPEIEPRPLGSGRPATPPETEPRASGSGRPATQPEKANLPNEQQPGDAASNYTLRNPRRTVASPPAVMAA